ncbi:tetrapyrrole methylase [Lipomyces oligophaga]|uniref:tetrapyrrole methylase n=1 Tax=Lipomyces oligophaga TaxID=45792 RepID=UPI0034CFA1D3
MPSLLISRNCADEIHLIVGGSAVSLSRAAKLLDCGASKVITICPEPSVSESWNSNASTLEKDSNGRFLWIKREFRPQDLTTLGRSEVDHVVDAVFVAAIQQSYGVSISEACRRLRIPVNVADSPGLSTFSLLSTYTNGPLQIGVTTSGKGCRLASRIRREIVSNLPTDVAIACERIGELKQQIQSESEGRDSHYPDDVGQNEDDAIQSHKFNQLVGESTVDEDLCRLNRMRWLSQVVEYFPFSELATLSVDKLSSQYHEQFTQNGNNSEKSSPVISLVGSGPGDPGLLTTAALSAITTADLVLADKLVPSAVLELIPQHVEKYIARKFPGNAEAAQQELLDIALEALRQNKSVVRLKQGDPYIFGRGAEEYIFFSKNGYQPIVIPGITSALSGPLLAAISPTHRQVADQVLICTGTGRKGAQPSIPEFVESRTTIFLMALHRIADLVTWLSEKNWPVTVPCAIIERASCPDQRVIRTSLQYVVEAFEKSGSRPPGILVVGYSCAVIQPVPESSRWSINEGLV